MGKMVLENSLYSALDLYTKEMNKELENGKSLFYDYKCYDKEQDNFLHFYIWDIKSTLASLNKIMLSSFEYNGSFRFSYDKIKKKVIIHELPFCKYGEVEIPIFTHDIASIISDKLEKYELIENINITFSNIFLVFAIDNKVEELLPLIKNTYNYKMVVKLMNQIKNELKKIEQDILNEKAKKDKEERKQEIAISKKRKIYGIDPIDYSDMQDFFNIINKKICEVCDYKIRNIRRHIGANKTLYKQIILENMTDIEFFKIPFEECWSGSNEKYNGYTIKDLSDFLHDCDFDISNVSKEILEKYCNMLIEKDLSHEKNSRISIIKEADTEEWRWRYYQGDYCPDPAAEYYISIIQDLQPMSKYHPIFSQSYYSNSEDLKKAIDLLVQISELEKQQDYYLNMRKNPSTAILNFTKNNDTWGSIMSFPYWLRLERDLLCSTSDKDRFYLFMIKPGVKEINYEDVRTFASKKGKYFGTCKTGRMNFYNNVSRMRNFYCDRLIVTVPQSLEYEHLLKLIEFSHENGYHLNFICETPDVAILVKNIIVIKELEERKNDNKYLTGNCFINVDPNYYNSFFVDTPNNKTLWHRYDYTSTYKYRRKDPTSLNVLIEGCIYNNQYENNDVANYQQIEEQLLGTYLSSYDPEIYSVENIGMGGHLIYLQEVKWNAECSYTYEEYRRARKEREKRLYKG